MGIGAHRRGTFVVPLDQTELDGVPAAPASAIAIGSVLRWRGRAVQLDGPPEWLLLGRADGGAELRARARQSVRRFFGRQFTDAAAHRTEDMTADDPAPIRGITLTDGRLSYAAMLIGAGGDAPILAFDGDLPPSETDLFVIDHSGMAAAPEPAGVSGGVVCFTPGTLIATPDGPRPVEAIRPGDRITTRDDGPQDVQWTGARRMSGARLYAMPHLRPVRIRAGAMGEDRPEGDLLVSPDHRLLIRGPQARALFNEDEVLVAAGDLIDGHGIHTETGLREVTYIHLMTERHQIVWANGVESESFHPAAADFEQLESGQRASLFDLMPGLAEDPFLYGDYARRSLSASEAAILRFEAA